MESKYKNILFWEPFVKSIISVQGSKESKVYFKAKVTSVEVGEGNLEISFVDAIGKVGLELSPLVRSFEEVKIEETADKLIIYQEYKPDLYISKPQSDRAVPTTKIEIVAVRGPQLVEPEQNLAEKLIPYKGQDWNINLKNIVLFRHGDTIRIPNDEPALSYKGRQAVKFTIDAIEAKVGNTESLVFSSIARRAFESGLLAADKFGAICERFECFGDPSGNRYDLDAALELIFARQRVDPGLETIIIATHEPLCKRFPEFLAAKLYGGTAEQFRLAPAEAIMMDLVNRRVFKITGGSIPS